MRVISHNRLQGGTKRVVAERLLRKTWRDHKTLVYATPAFGLAQVALAVACKDAGRNCVLFTAKRNELHPLTLEAQAAGAEVVQVPYGYLTNVQAKARRFAEENDFFLVPFGLDCPEVVLELAALARLETSKAPKEVWCAGGSGTLTRGLQLAWPEAQHNCVLVGTRKGNYGKARLWIAPEKYEQKNRVHCPFPANPNYDAKIWQFAEKHFERDSLIWIVN